MTDRDQEFDRWFRTEYRRVLSSVIVVCAGDLVRAEDATNDAFVKAFERWPKVRVMDAPTSWVTKVAINVAKRSFSLRRRHMPLSNQDVAVHDAELEIDPNLWAAVDRLPMRQREAIVLRYVDDLTQPQVAKSLHVATGTAAATLSQARTNLRAELEGDRS